MYFLEFFNDDNIIQITRAVIGGGLLGCLAIYFVRRRQSIKLHKKEEGER